MNFCVLIKVSNQNLTFWYQLEGGEPAPLVIKDSNVVPLYFYINNNEFEFGSFARLRAQSNDPNSYSNYFTLIKDSSKCFTLFGDSKPVKQLIYFGIELYLSHFIKTILYKHDSIEAYRTNFCLRFWFEDDISQPERVLLKNLFVDAGYENIDEVKVDYFLNLILSDNANSSRARLVLRSIYNDLYVTFFTSEFDKVIAQKNIEGQGSDPRAKVIAQLILEDVKEANPHIHIDFDQDISFILEYCSKLLDNITPIMRGQIELSSGNRSEYKIKKNDLEDRLIYNRGVEDKIIPVLEEIVSTNKLNLSSVDIFLLGNEINIVYFKEKINKKFPYVFGIDNQFEVKLIERIYADIISNNYLVVKKSLGSKTGEAPPLNKHLSPNPTPPPINTPPKVNIPSTTPPTPQPVKVKEANKQVSPATSPPSKAPLPPSPPVPPTPVKQANKAPIPPPVIPVKQESKAPIPPPPPAKKNQAPVPPPPPTPAKKNQAPVPPPPPKRPPPPKKS